MHNPARLHAMQLSEFGVSVFGESLEWIQKYGHKVTACSRCCGLLLLLHKQSIALTGPCIANYMLPPGHPAPFHRSAARAVCD